MIHKNGKIVSRTIPYKLQFIETARLWQAHYQILLIILLKEFIKLNANMKRIIKNAKCVKLTVEL